MPIEQHYGGCKNACATRNEKRVAARQEVRATRNEKRRREMEKNRCPDSEIVRLLRGIVTR